ncbi:S9 family peptidase [Evansella tamaricis]|uniref:S9 family peptidase n=1 Tax=Evansella tamaricis TaxID=2069301 RepID=A0ABS6JI70_9BACI|nr:S9 family peptidase [Evansella tamaricis]MBU9712160.1 S9 family peptidase [Evansella tamaricis]
MKKRITSEDIFQFKAPGDIKLSPDGRHMIFTLKELDKEKDENVTNLFLINIDTSETKQLTFSGKDSDASFSPDGKRVAFVSSRSEKAQIWILPLDGGETWCLKTKEAVQAPLIWTPDGKCLIYSASVFSHDSLDWVPYPGAPVKDRQRLKELSDKIHQEKEKDDNKKKENEVKIITRFSYRFDGQGYFGHVRNQIFTTPVPQTTPGDWEPKGQQLTKGDYDHSGPSLSPNGEYLVVSSRHTKDADMEQKVDLWLIHIPTGKSHLLYDSPGPTSNPSWSPCGNYIAFTGHDNQVGASTTMNLWLIDMRSFLVDINTKRKVVPINRETAKNLSKVLDRPIGGAGSDVGYRGGKAVVWGKDRIYFVITDHGAGQVYEIRLDKLDQFPTKILGDDNCSIVGIDAGENGIAYTFSSPEKAQEIYFKTRSGKTEQLTSFNKHFLEKVEIGEWEKFQYSSNDGEKLDGWLVFPPNYEPTEKYPLVLLIHGGPHGSYGPTFMFTAHQFAAQGYIIIYTNPRGSETYGQDFASHIDTKWGDQDYKDIMAGVDYVVDRKIIDEDRMFVHGWSYGGYMSCWIATQTDRFKAICAGASVTNMISGYGTSDITLADEYEYGGSPWEHTEHFKRHSPLGHVQNVTTPMMLMHGENDLRVAISQTEEFYIALKRLGKEAIMVRYPDEFHGLTRPVHQHDRFERIVSWFNYYADIT